MIYGESSSGLKTTQHVLKMTSMTRKMTRDDDGRACIGGLWLSERKRFGSFVFLLNWRPKSCVKMVDCRVGYIDFWIRLLINRYLFIMTYSS